MREWRERLEERSFGWFVSASLLTAAVVVFCGGSPPVVGQTEPLRLALSAPQICETTPAEQAHEGVLDEHGELVAVPFGWRNPGTVRVAWTVSGGVAPYRLTIDGQMRDGETGEFFTAQRGEGVVGCARTSGEWFFRPDPSEEDAGGTDGDSWFTLYHREQPEVDSGVKEIIATVTDATGATAETSAGIYVILSVPGRGVLMEPGKTYRIYGTLLTVPDGIRLELNDALHDGFALSIVGHPSGQPAWIIVTEPGIPHGYAGLEELSRQVPDAATSGVADDGIDLHAKLDELLQSVQQPPNLNREGEPE